MNKLDKIIERWSKITPGPWGITDRGEIVSSIGRQVVGLDEGDPIENEDDLMAIGHAPQDIEYLLKIITDLKAELSIKNSDDIDWPPRGE